MIKSKKHLYDILTLRYIFFILDDHMMRNEYKHLRIQNIYLMNLWI